MLKRRLNLAIFFILGLLVTFSTSSYAKEDLENLQKIELKKAIDDEENVVNSISYKNYATDTTKSMYTKALARAKEVYLDDTSSFKDFSEKTKDINTARKAIQYDGKNGISYINFKEDIKKFKKSISIIKTKRDLDPEFFGEKLDEVDLIIENAQTIIEKSEKIIYR